MSVSYKPPHEMPPHPGEVLKRLLKQVGLTQSQLIQRMGTPQKRSLITRIINEERPITEETAILLGDVAELRHRPEWWLKKQQTFSLHQTYFKKIRHTEKSPIGGET